MRLYGAIEKIEAQTDGTVRVHGIAASEAVDEQGEIVRAAAMRAAMPDYMRFPALREMHQLSAAGTTLEAEVGEDGTTRIVAHVVDPVAVAKVKNQVYRGFSIGGRVTQRDAANPKVITALVLNEISLVDRPANPEAIFDCWKAANDGKWLGKMPVSSMSKQTTAAQGPFNSPLQIWACEFSEHRHLTKAEAIKCLEKRDSESADLQTEITSTTAVVPSDTGTGAAADNHEPSVEEHDRNVVYADPGYQPDGKKRYPIDSERHIRAAWDYINKPGNASKYNSDQLRGIKAAIIAAWKARIDKDGPPSAGNSGPALQAASTKAPEDICRIERMMVDLDWLKNTLDLQTAIGDDGSQQSTRPREIAGALWDFLNDLVMPESDSLLGNAEQNFPPPTSATPQLLAMTASVSDLAQIAAPLEEGGPEMRRPATALLSKVKPSQADQVLMDIAHGCLSELTDGTLCGKTMKIGARHSNQTLQHLETAHHQLVAAGAKCGVEPLSRSDAASEDGSSDAELMPGKNARIEDVAKLVAGEPTEEAALLKVLGEIVPMIEQLSRRVDEIARTPLPPLTMAKNAASVSKRQDGAGTLDSGGAESSSEAVAAAFAKMSKEEQTLTLIKASYAKPIRIRGATADEG